MIINGTLSKRVPSTYWFLVVNRSSWFPLRLWYLSPVLTTTLRPLGETPNANNAGTWWRKKSGIDRSRITTSRCPLFLMGLFNRQLCVSFTNVWTCGRVGVANGFWCKWTRKGSLLPTVHELVARLHLHAKRWIEVSTRSWKWMTPACRKTCPNSIKIWC